MINRAWIKSNQGSGASFFPVVGKKKKVGTADQRKEIEIEKNL